MHGAGRQAVGQALHRPGGRSRGDTHSKPARHPHKRPSQRAPIARKRSPGTRQRGTACGKTRTRRHGAGVCAQGSTAAKSSAALGRRHAAASGRQGGHAQHGGGHGHWCRVGTETGPATRLETLSLPRWQRALLNASRCCCRRNTRCQAPAARRRAPGAPASLPARTLGVRLPLVLLGCEPRLAAPRAPAASSRCRPGRRPSRRTRHGLCCGPVVRPALPTCPPDCPSPPASPRSRASARRARTPSSSALACPWWASACTRR